MTLAVPLPARGLSVWLAVFAAMLARAPSLARPPADDGADADAARAWAPAHG